jgi:hypothetical protein
VPWLPSDDVVQLKPTSLEDWQAAALACPYATFFHSPFWTRLAQAGIPGARSATLNTVLPSGTHVVYPLLTAGRRSGPVMSTYAGCYGGPIAVGKLSGQDYSELHGRLCRAFKGPIKITTNPLAPHQFLPARYRATREDQTQILELEKDFAVVRARFSRGHRSAIGKAQRAGITVSAAESRSEFEDYYGMYRASLARWGAMASSDYPWAVFAAASQLAQEVPEHVRLWLAKRDGELLAGALVFYWNRHAVYWHGAAYEQHFRLRPTNLLFATVIANACERGFAYFDFNPSGGHDGPAEFKRRFGAKPYKVTTFRHIGTGQRLRARAVRLALSR